MRKFLVVYCVTVLTVSVNCIAQQKIEIGQADAKRDSLLDLKPKKFKTRFTPFIAPSLAPETELMIIAGGLFSFKFQPYDSLLNQSSIPFSVGYSTNQSLLVNVRPYLYFTDDRYRLYGDIWLKNMPDNYFGVGYNKNSSLERGEGTTEYQRDWWQINLKFLRNIYHDIYLGILFDFNSTDATDLNPVMAQDENVLRDGQNIRNRGLGVNVEYDSRDMPVNAYEGLFLNLSCAWYGEYLGTDFDYSVYILDYRQYKKIERSGRTLAWQIKGRFSNGQVPWPELSQLGTPFDLRGYRWGHYRDKKLLFGMVEYRHMFLRKKPDQHGSKLSKHGFVTWIATGSIAPKANEFDDWLPNGGFGYRFEVQPRMAARLDFGFGKKAFGVYVSFNEAF